MEYNGWDIFRNLKLSDFIGGVFVGSLFYSVGSYFQIRDLS